MKCAHCGTKPETVYVWTLQACAEKRRKRKPGLCLPCDIALNRLILEFIRAPNIDQKMADYEASR
jgi:hypothetical protein